MSSSRSRADRDRDRIRSLDRLIARLERDGLSLGLAQAWLERAELLLRAEEFREALAQLDTLLESLPRIERPEAPLLVARACVTRARFHHHHGEGLNSALEDLDRAIAALAASSVADPDLVKLEVELWVYRGRLLMLEDKEASLSSLRRAVELAEGHKGEGKHLVVLGARRELSVGLAQEDIEAGLSELTRAAEEARAVGIPEVDQQMLRSTHAELLANSGRFEEALAQLGLEDPNAPDWALSQGAVTCEMARDTESALNLGQRLIEMRQQVYEQQPGTVCIFAEALIAQAQRAADPEERHALAQRARRVLEEFPARLSIEGERLLTSALELVATCLEEPADLHEVLSERASLLEALVRDHGAHRDQIEQVRCWLQLGDVLMDQGQPGEALRHYGWARNLLETWPPEEPVVLGLLPLALHAIGHAYAHQEQWLSARRTLDEAIERLATQSDPEVLTNFAEIFLFRALTYVSVGDPRGAVTRLREDITRLQDCILRRSEADAAHLLETVVNLHVLQAEILVDHLEEPDKAIESYDQACQLRELAKSPTASLATLLGAKGALLNEFGRSDEALPLLRQSLELFLNGGSETGPARLGDVALARVNIAASLSGLGKPRDALTEIGQAKDVLEGVDGDVEDRERLRHQAIRTHMFLQRGEALFGVGHPLLAADEYTRTIDLCAELLDEDEGDAYYEARLRLPLALLRRARCWVDSENHRREAQTDLRKAYKLYAGLLKDEARPEHRRRLREVRDLQRHLGDV